MDRRIIYAKLNESICHCHGNLVRFFELFIVKKKRKGIPITVRNKILQLLEQQDHQRAIKLNWHSHIGVSGTPIRDNPFKPLQCLAIWKLHKSS